VQFLEGRLATVVRIVLVGGGVMAFWRWSLLSGYARGLILALCGAVLLLVVLLSVLRLRVRARAPWSAENGGQGARMTALLPTQTAARWCSPRRSAPRVSPTRDVLSQFAIVLTIPSKPKWLAPPHGCWGGCNPLRAGAAWGRRRGIPAGVGTRCGRGLLRATGPPRRRLRSLKPSGQRGGGTPPTNPVRGKGQKR
jgi:hypothetical protein